MIYFTIITVILAVVGSVVLISKLYQFFGLLDSIESSIEKISKGERYEDKGKRI